MSLAVLLTQRAADERRTWWLWLNLSCQYKQILIRNAGSEAIVACRPQVCKAKCVCECACQCVWVFCVYAWVCVRVLNKHMGGILKRAQTQYSLSQSGPSIHKQRTQAAVKASAREREREKLLYWQVSIKNLALFLLVRNAYKKCITRTKTHKRVARYGAAFGWVWHLEVLLCRDM